MQERMLLSHLSAFTSPYWLQIEPATDKVAAQFIHKLVCIGRAGKNDTLFRSLSDLPLAQGASRACLQAEEAFAMLQVGLASNKAQYSHRLGRMERTGKYWKGMLPPGNCEDLALPRLPVRAAHH